MMELLKACWEGCHLLDDEASLDPQFSSSAGVTMWLSRLKSLPPQIVLITYGNIDLNR